MSASPSNRLVTFGETMGLFGARHVGRFGVERDFVLGIGGSEANVAIGAARLGATVTWFGRVGSDSIGELISRTIGSEGVEALAIQDPGFTGLMVKHQRFANAAHIDYHRTGSAGSRLRPDDIPVDRIREAAVLHVSGITPALSRSCRQTVFRAVELARASGVPVSLDVNYRAKLWARDVAGPVLKELATCSDIVFAGREESDLVTGAASAGAADAVRNLHGLGITEAVVKDGPRGCAAIVDDVFHELPACRVSVVDTVGAGDAFVAGYLAERLAGEDGATRLATANRAGALAVSVPGDCESLPYRRELRSADDDVVR